jgi:hypothetical protein
MKNILGAYKSTLIGIGIAALTAIHQAMSTPPVNWKAVGASVVLAVILALTNVLKEKQNQP